MQNLYPIDIREEELKLRVAKDWFADYDTTRILGSIDFCVSVPNENSLFRDEVDSLVWGEAKQGKRLNRCAVGKRLTAYLRQKLCKTMRYSIEAYAFNHSRAAVDAICTCGATMQIALSFAFAICDGLLSEHSSFS